MKIDRKKVMEQWEAYWGRRVRKGQSSGMSRLEEMAIGLFLRWLAEKYEPEEKGEKGEHQQG